MANELNVQNIDWDGLTVYGRIWGTGVNAGLVYNTLLGQFETWGAGTVANWSITMNTAGEGLFLGDIPAGLPQGSYWLRYHARADAPAGAAKTDPTSEQSRKILWDGTKEIDAVDLSQSVAVYVT